MADDLCMYVSFTYICIQDGKTARLVALQKRKMDIVRLLLQRPDINLNLQAKVSRENYAPKLLFFLI